MLPIKLAWNVYVTRVWQMRSKSVTNSCEFFTRCEEFVRIIHTCEKYEVWILRFNRALILIKKYSHEKSWWCPVAQGFYLHSPVWWLMSRVVSATFMILYFLWDAKCRSGFPSMHHLHLSHVMRKPVLYHMCRSACAFAQPKQCLCCSLPG